MTEFTKEEATPELRWQRRNMATGIFRWGKTSVVALQQKWRITNGADGKVMYSEEWRDLPVVTEDAE